MRARGIISLVVFALSAVVHFCTFIPPIPVSMAATWPLHLATMGVFAMMVFALVAEQKKQPRRPATGLFGRWREAQRSSKEFQSRLLGAVPGVLRVACVLVFLYAIVNFALFMFLMEGGSPGIKDGQPYLHHRGRKVRDLTMEEYRRLLAYEARGFSGHWMVFSLLPTVYFLSVHSRLRGEDE